MSTTLRSIARGTLSLAVLAALAGLTPWAPVDDARAQQGEKAQQQQKAELFAGQLQPVGDSGVEGTVRVQSMGEQLRVQVNATGLSSGAHGQHIHEGSSCESVGGIAVPLDQSLGTVEDGFGGEFPSTGGESGTLSYSQTGSNPQFADLDLASTVVAVHSGVPGGAVACAELEKKGD